jgi:putative endonuclease
MYYVYVLRSQKNGRFYTGSTNDWRRRIAEHNEGRSTASRPNRPFETILIEEYESRSAAVQRELILKSGKGREEIERIRIETGVSGPVDQLGDRLHGMEKAEGSSPFRSTNSPDILRS